MTARKNIAVYGIYPDQLTAEDAVDSLKDSGFRSTDISVLFPDNQGTKDFAHEKHTKAPEAAVTGGTSGAVLGGALGWLAGIGALAIPGVGPFIAAGPVKDFLGGGGGGGAGGGVWGRWGSGVPSEALRALWLVSECPSTKRNGTKEESERAVSCFPSIATIPIG